MTEDDERDVQTALHCAETGSATHWPTAAGVLADEVKRLRGLSADPATIERVAAAVLAAMRDLSRESRWWAAMRTVEIPDNEQAAKFISEAAVRALQGEA